MTATVKFFRDTYIDSVLQLSGMRAMREVDGVSWATAAMATPANVATLQAEGVEPDDLEGAKSNDLVLVVLADDPNVREQALAAGESAVFSARAGTGRHSDGSRAPRSMREAMRAQPDANVAVVSVPGEYAALATYQALSAGLHVLLFSDNVPVEEEIALKDYAISRGLLMMGPGAGTAMIGRASLGFANVVTPGPVGVIAAAGTGAQEAMALLDRWGIGVAQVIGLGGRDMSASVGGRMARFAIGTLRADPAVKVILFVSKPPAAEVAAAVLASTTSDAPLVATFIGLDRDFTAPPGVVLADTLESGVVAALRALRADAPDPTVMRGPSVDSVRDRLADRRVLIRGLFSGGTLCYESLAVLGPVVGEVRSNTPINPLWGLPAPPGSHQCLDLGEEEYTKGRPHPMIDAEARIDVLREHAADPDVAAIILDVVLGYGAHADPAGVLAPACESVMADGGPQIVAYVLGTDGDPQGFSAQRDRLVAAGCIVTETSARASLVAAAIATGDPSLVDARL